MDLVGSHPLLHDDQEDADFFDQLADDLGNENHDSGVEQLDSSILSNQTDVTKEYLQGEANFGDAFAKLKIDEKGLEATTLVHEEAVLENRGSDTISAADDKFWEESNCGDEARAGRTFVSGSHETTIEAHQSSLATPATTTAGLATDVHASESFGPEVSGLSNGSSSAFEGLQKSESDVSSAIFTPPQESGATGMVGNQINESSLSFESSNLSFFAVDESHTTPTKSEISTVETPELELSRSEPMGSSTLRTQTGSKELQWSSFTTVCSGEDKGAFGSFSDLSALGGDVSRPELNSGWMADSGSMFNNVWNLTSDGVGSGQEPQAGSVRHLGIREFNELGHGGGLEQDNKWPGHSQGQGAGVHGHVSDVDLSAQGQGFSPILDEQAQKHNLVGDSRGAAEDQRAGYEQSWENLYPGWYYDYTENTWKQIEGSNVNADAGYSWNSPSAVADSQPSVNDTSQILMSSAKDEGVSHEILQNEVVGQGDEHQSYAVLHSNQSVWSAVLEGARTFSQAEMGPTEMVQVGQQQVVNDEAEAQQQYGWDQQYPGWYYDYQAQEWRQTADNNQWWQPGQLIDSSQEWQHGLDSTSYTHGQHSVLGGAAQGIQGSGYQVPDTGSLPQSQGNWMGKDRQSGQQHISHNESEKSFYGGSVPSSDIHQVYSRGTSFNAWMGAAPAASWNHNYSKDSVVDSSHQTKSAPNQQFDTGLTFQGGLSDSNGVGPWLGIQSYENGPSSQFYDKSQMDYTQTAKVSYYNNRQTPEYFPQMFQYADTAIAPKTSSEALRSSAGRPPHTLANFGFGGKLVVMKLNYHTTQHTTSGNQAISRGEAWTSGPAVVHNLSQLVVETSDSRSGVVNRPYFTALSCQGFPGPLSGAISIKELVKWIDERAANCELEEPDYTNPEALRLLWGLLKIACQHYGKLRSMVSSTGISLQAEDGPEVALAKLLTTFKGSPTPADHLQSMPSEHQMQATVLEMKNLLVAGKRKEALQHAQQGQLWGLALVLARQLGEKFYADTVTQMAQQQFMSGSPLRTLCLLLAGHSTEVFALESLFSPVPTVSSYPFGGYSHGQGGSGGVLRDWLENLAIIAANRSKGDEKIIMHLGDSLWKARGEVAGAHACYLVAEANFDWYSETARLCLVGADHFKNPRTFASPEAIQRTELYEYAKVLGNPQFILLPFQPYKLMYANMLAESGKITEALRYCQVITKTLRNAGRAPEVEFCRQATVALEDRLRLHSQGGYSLNLAPGKLVGKFLSTIDSTIHKIIGGPPPLQSSDSQTSALESLAYDNRTGSFPRGVPGSLMPSASMEPISNLMNGSNQVDMPPRSISEPDFSKNPKQGLKPKADQTEEEKFASTNLVPPSTPSKQSNTEPSGGSYFGLFGSQFLARAVGLIRHNKKEAKLGEKNKFYFDEKLKRWVEEGAEPSPEEVALAPPPTTAKFVSNVEPLAMDLKAGAGRENGVSPVAGFSSSSSGMPPSVNQFSARGRFQGVQSRYVDTFNKGGSSQSPANLVQPSIVPSAGLGLTSTPAKFFVPVPALPSSINDYFSQQVNDERSHEHTAELGSNATLNPVPNGYTEAEQEGLVSGNLFSSMKAFPSIQRHSSAGNVANDGLAMSKFVVSGTNTVSVANGSMPRAVSWSGYPTPVPQGNDNNAATSIVSTTAINSSILANHGRGETHFFQPVIQQIDASKFSSEEFYSTTLPSPPLVEPPRSHSSMDNSFAAGIREGGSVTHIGSGPHFSAPVGVYGDMQEVEL